MILASHIQICYLLFRHVSSFLRVRLILLNISMSPSYQLISILLRHVSSLLWVKVLLSIPVS